VFCTPVFGQTTATKSCEIRGQVAGTVNGMSNLDSDDYSFTWNPQNFAGFFYDIKKDLGTEQLTVVLTEDNKLSGDAPYGITYTTSAQNKNFERALWGSYKLIGFRAEKYFAGYNEGEEAGSSIFFRESTDENSLSSEQLEKILIDSKDEMTVTSGTPVKLAEGYELVIKLIDTRAMYLELTKNGQVVDTKVISPSVEYATEVDKTYYYRNPAVGDQENLVTIGVHFKNALNIQNHTVATVDGIWQISETPTEVKADTQYGKMTISSVDGNNGIIIMNNKDNAITLGRNKDIILMPGINIMTGDSDALRFYIYSQENCQCG
jgi:S-layer protein (TIGR01567 family)